MLRWSRRPTRENRTRLNVLDAGYAEGVDYDVSGTDYFPEAYRQLGARRTDRAEVELVPDPKNRHDGWAVAVEVRGVRAGYLGAAQAMWWHDVIHHLNASGTDVASVGHVASWDPPELLIALPRWHQWLVLAQETGLIAQAEAALKTLPKRELDHLIARAYEPSDQDAATIHQVAKLAPSLSWNKTEGYGRPGIGLPPVVFEHVLREWRKAQRAQARIQRESARLALAQEREAQRRAAAAQRRDEVERKRSGERDRALQLWNEGLSKTAIAQYMGCGTSKVSTLLKELGAAPRPVSSSVAHGVNAANTRARDERLGRCRTAVSLQRQGATRAQIAEAMSCSIDTVKELLRDGRFYENPGANPQRLETAQRCWELRQAGKTRAQIAEELQLSASALTSVMRDADTVLG